MANNQSLTVQDVYNPVDTQLKIQSINESKMRNRITAMKMREAHQQQMRRDKWNALSNDPRGRFNPISGQFTSQSGPVMQMPASGQPRSAQAAPPTPVQAPENMMAPQPGAPQMQQVPLIDDETKSAIRGQKKFMSMSKAVQPLMQKAKTDPAIRERMTKMVSNIENDNDHKALIKKAGYDEMNIIVDPDTGETSYSLAKNWTADELEAYATNAPNGSILAPLTKHPGNYRIKFNDVGAVIGAEMVGGVQSMLGDKNLTENEIIARAMHGDVEAKKWMAAKIDFEKQKSVAKGGALTPEATRLMAKQAMLDPKMLSKLPRGGSSRVDVVNEINRIAKEDGLLVPDLTMKKTKLNAIVKAYNNQKVSYEADRKMADEFFMDVARFKPMIARLRTNHPSLINASLVQLRKMSANASLGEEAVLAQELDAIMRSYIRIANDASNSIAEPSATAQEAAKKMLNMNSPAFVLIQQFENFEKAMQDKMTVRKNRVDDLERQAREVSRFGKRLATSQPASERVESTTSSAQPVTPKAPVKIGRFTVEVE